MKEKWILIRGQEEKEERRGVCDKGKESKYRQGMTGREARK